MSRKTQMAEAPFPPWHEYRAEHYAKCEGMIRLIGPEHPNLGFNELGWPAVHVIAISDTPIAIQEPLHRYDTIEARWADTNKLTKRLALCFDACRNLTDEELQRVANLCHVAETAHQLLTKGPNVVTACALALACQKVWPSMEWPTEFISKD